MPSLLMAQESAEGRFRDVFGARRSPNMRAASGCAFTHRVALGSGDLYLNVGADEDMHSRVPFLWFEEDGEHTVCEHSLWRWRSDTLSVISGLGVILHEESYSGPHGLEYRATHSESGNVLSVATKWHARERLRA